MSERNATPGRPGPRRGGSRKIALGHDSRTGAYVPVEMARKGPRAAETALRPEGKREVVGKAALHRGRDLSRAVDLIESRPIEGALEEVITAKLGGEAVLRRPVKTAEDIVELVRAGLPLRAFDTVRISGRFTEKELQAVIPSRTLRHRRTKRERLTVEESDRAVRLLRIQTLADMAFGNTRKADRWLRRPSAMFNGKTALETANTEAGARIVETLLAKIAWGAAA